jgi:hypothetical protein
MSPRARRLHPSRSLRANLTVLGLGALALGPVLFSRGYVLVADMTFVPDQPWKAAWLGLDGSVPRAVPADAVVAVLDDLVPGDLLQKAILLGVLVLAGVGMLRLTARVPGIAGPARLGGAALYVWNPYVFERLAIGHWGLLVGYAALPWVLAAALDVRRGAQRSGGRLFLLLLLAAAGSPTGGLVAGLVAVVMSADRNHVRRAAAVAGSVVLVNLPWLAPALLNETAPSDGAGVAAFAATSDTPFGAWGSLLTFGGIWKVAAAPRERDEALLVVASLLLVLASLVALGRSALGRRARNRRADHPLAPLRLVVLAVLGLVLAGLPATQPGERLVTDLVDAVAGAGLWRDSQKWLMPFVLVVCVGFAVLIDGLARRLRQRDLPAGAVTVALALVPVVLLPSLAWGLSGRFATVEYPDEWRTVRRVLEHQPAADRRIAVLPWSAYQRLPWNDRRAALDPALRFFPGEVVASEDLAISADLTVRGEDRAAAAIGRALAGHRPLGPALGAAGVRYLLVERTAPSAVTVALPSGTVLHDGPELLLLDLGGHGRTSRAPHRTLILAADGITVLGALVATVLLIRRKPDDPSGTMHPGAVSTAT